MASPLVTSVQKAQMVQSDAAEDAYTERITERTSSGRFERTESVQARAFKGRRAGNNRMTLARQAAQQGAWGRQKPGVRITSWAGETSGKALEAYQRMMRMAEFADMWVVLGGVAIGIAVPSVIGLMILFFIDTTVGALVAGTVTLATFGSTDLKTTGLIFLGLSLCISVISHIAMLAYVRIRHQTDIMQLEGNYFTGAIILLVAGLVPGLNIAPWFILFTYCLFMAPKPAA